METNLLSVNVDKAKKRIKKLQNQIDELQAFIESAEGYIPNSFEQRVLKEYSYLGNIQKVLEKLNMEIHDGHDGNRYKSSDIIEIILSKPTGSLHKFVQKIYRTNQKNSREKKPKFYYI